MERLPTRDRSIVELDRSPCARVVGATTIARLPADDPEADEAVPSVRKLTVAGMSSVEPEPRRVWNASSARCR